MFVWKFLIQLCVTVSIIHAFWGKKGENMHEMGLVLCGERVALFKSCVAWKGAVWALNWPFPPKKIFFWYSHPSWVSSWDQNDLGFTHSLVPVFCLNSLTLWWSLPVMWPWFHCSKKAFSQIWRSDILTENFNYILISASVCSGFC